MKKKIISLLKYILGLSIIAIGIAFSNRSGLGISPVSSIPRALEVASNGLFSLGTMVIVVYIVLVIMQLIVLKRKFKWKNLLGVPVALIFGLLVDVFGINVNKSLHLLSFLPVPTNYIFRLIYLILSIIIIAIGVTTYLSANLVPMPAEGLAMAISEVNGKAFGNMKTVVDVSLITIALIIQLIFLGGLSSFVSDTIVVREGTILSAIFVGQLVKVFKKLIIKIKEKSLNK